MASSSMYDAVVGRKWGSFFDFLSRMAIDLGLGLDLISLAADDVSGGGLKASSTSLVVRRGLATDRQPILLKRHSPLAMVSR